MKKQMYNDWHKLKIAVLYINRYRCWRSGTPELYRDLLEKIVLIDPLDEAQKFYEDHMGNRGNIL